jgi:hypothetical protein
MKKYRSSTLSRIYMLYCQQVNSTGFASPTANGLVSLSTIFVCENANLEQSQGDKRGSCTISMKQE